MESTVLKPENPAEAKRILKAGAYIRIKSAHGAFHEVALFEKDGSLTFYGKRYESADKARWLNIWSNIIMDKGYEIVSHD